MGTNYHNEVLRQVRILEKQREFRNRPQHTQVDDYDQSYSNRLISEIRDKATESDCNQVTSTKGYEYTFGIERNRQMYDHSRDGPLRDDSWKNIHKDIHLMFGKKYPYKAAFK